MTIAHSVHAMPPRRVNIYWRYTMIDPLTHELHHQDFLAAKQLPVEVMKRLSARFGRDFQSYETLSDEPETLRFAIPDTECAPLAVKEYFAWLQTLSLPFHSGYHGSKFFDLEDRARASWGIMQWGALYELTEWLELGEGFGMLNIKLKIKDYLKTSRLQPKELAALWGQLRTNEGLRSLLIDATFKYAAGSGQFQRFNAELQKLSPELYAAFSDQHGSHLGWRERRGGWTRNG